ncbi:hypothetical protein C1645_835879 [Glomus cerebriforme]|uniref:Uncharacterized protein n=1 Tax=Glomus cerebriforme TaxID=658196 RepID=A0A397S6U9_9GLOM|nr:hypothetical protein C1645_835879 [Glomus cerebriforme]
MPNSIPDAEYHRFTLVDHTGKLLSKPPSKQVKDIYEVANTSVVYQQFKIDVDDNDSVSVLEHVKRMTRKLRPKCNLTNIILELWKLVPKTTDTKELTILYNEESANDAIQDADKLSQTLLNYTPENYISCIKEYENEMLKRTSTNVLKSRSIALK